MRSPEHEMSLFVEGFWKTNLSFDAAPVGAAKYFQVILRPSWSLFFIKITCCIFQGLVRPLWTWIIYLWNQRTANFAFDRRGETNGHYHFLRVIVFVMMIIMIIFLVVCFEAASIIILIHNNITPNITIAVIFFSVQKWRRRWFVLRQGAMPGQFLLHYYTDPLVRIISIITMAIIFTMAMIATKVMIVTSMMIMMMMTGYDKDDFCWKPSPPHSFHHHCHHLHYAAPLSPPHGLCFFRRGSWKVLLTSTSASRCLIIIIILYHHHNRQHHHNSIVGGHWADLPVWQSVLPVHVWHQDPKASLLPCRWLWGRYDRMGWLGLSGNLGGPQK